MPRYVFHVQDGIRVAFDAADYADDRAALEAAREHAKLLSQDRPNPSRVVAVNEAGEDVAEVPIDRDSD